ncbi:MAG: hypothetical protein ACI9JN_001428 [Bacteroidia bacterium]|jgi:hypothetical protein
MIRKFYHNGVKTLTVILSVLISAQFVSAQMCGSIDLGDDDTVCTGTFVTLTPTENLNLTGNLSRLLAYVGVVSNPSCALGHQVAVAPTSVEEIQGNTLELFGLCLVIFHLEQNLKLE